MNESDLTELVALMREQLDGLRDQERLDLMNRIMAGWCAKCGCDMGGANYCHCDNDE